MKKDRSRCCQENLVKLAIEVLEKKVDPRFGRRRHLQRLNIHKQIKNKYHKIFYNITTYLKELRGDNKNDLSDMLIDYYTVIYRHFKKYGRAPSILNLSPSASNKIKFEEFIYEFTLSNREEYWIKHVPEPPEIVYVPIIPEDNNFIPSFVEV